MSQQQERVAVLVRVDPTLKKNLETIAAREHRSLSRQIEHALIQHAAAQQQEPR